MSAPQAGGRTGSLREGPNSAPNPFSIPGLAARARAADLLYGVVEQHKPLGSAFESGPQDGDHAGADRALTHALVLTALRRLPTLDAAIRACLEKPLHANAAMATAILRIMAAQLLVMDMADHAAVTLAVEDAARRRDTRKLKGLVNAVGRRMVRERDALLAAPQVSDLAPWLEARWHQAYGKPTTAAIAAVLSQQPSIDLTLKPGIDRQTYMEAMQAFAPVALHRHTIRLTKPGSIEALPGFEAGDWWIQDVAASLPAQLLLDTLADPKSARVLDLCAAPGGKTAQLASAGCAVIALDQSASRMKRLGENLKRLSLRAQTHVGDVLHYMPGELFDAVLLDAPCSATGTLRRNPDIAYVRSSKDISVLAKLQTDMLAAASKLVKPGGTLVYATCSLEPQEGEAQITRFLNQRSGWSLQTLTSEQAPAGIARGNKHLRTLPCMDAAQVTGQPAPGMDGFFVALLRAPA